MSGRPKRTTATPAVFAPENFIALKKKRPRRAKVAKGKGKGKGKGKRAKKDKNAPRKARTPFICFTVEMREKVRAENKDLNFGDIARELAGRWCTLSVKEKKKYEDMSAADKKRYEKEKAAYEKKQK